MAIVRPLSFTNVNWPEFIRLWTEDLGSSPVRTLDSNKISIDNPIALSLVLSDQLHHKIWQSVEQPDKLLQHTFLSFIVGCESSQVIHDITQYIELQSTVISPKLMILSGNMQEWYWAVINGCKECVSRETRTVFNEILKAISLTDFKKLWIDCRKTKLGDGTLVLS